MHLVHANRYLDFMMIDRPWHGVAVEPRNRLDVLKVSSSSRLRN